MPSEQIVEPCAEFRISENRLADPDIMEWLIDMYICIAAISARRRKSRDNFKYVAAELCRLSRLIYAKFVENGVVCIDQATKATDQFGLAATRIGDRNKDKEIQGFYDHIRGRECRVRQRLERHGSALCIDEPAYSEQDKYSLQQANSPQRNGEIRAIRKTKPR